MSNSLLIHAEYNKTETLSWTKYKNPKEFKNAGRKLLDENMRTCLMISVQSKDLINDKKHNP